MDSQNWWNVTKRNNKQSDGNREHRFSKASIGQPMSLQNSTSDSFPADNSNCSTMTMKCIILQKNEKGFGLTVSGDNPVYVQSVKEDGAAHKAGVHEGDRIIKVNGTNVTEYGHIEVVKLIKADSYVALTLLGVPGGSGSGQSGDASSNHHHHHHHGSHDHNKNSSNKFSQNPAKAQKDEAIKTIKMMLISSQSEYEKIKEEYAKMPSEKLLQDLRTAQNVKQGLEKKLWRANTSAESSNSSHAPASQPARSSRFITDIDESLGLEESKSELQSKRGISSSAMDLRSPPDPETSSTTGSTSSATNHQQQQQTFANRNTMHDIKLNVNGSSSVNRGSTDNMIQQLQQENDSLSSLRLQQPTMEVVRSPSSSSGGGGSFNVPVQNTDIINFEDDDIVENCSESRIQLCDHGPFNELERLKQRPAHFAVFLNYVLLSHEPQSLLFLIAVDSYKHISSTKDMHKQADAVYKHFLPPTATFKVDVDEAMASSIYNNLKTKNLSEDALRCMFDPAVQTCTREIRDQLGQYRHKREQGLGNMFGDEKLPQGDHTIDPQHEARLVDEIIGTKVHELHQPTSYFQDPSTERLHVVQEILHGFVIMYGTKRKAKFDRVLSILGNKPKGSNLSSRTKMSTSTETINEDSKTSKRFKHFVKTKKDGRSGWLPQIDCQT